MNGDSLVLEDMQDAGAHRRWWSRGRRAEWNVLPLSAERGAALVTVLLLSLILLILGMAVSGISAQQALFVQRQHDEKKALEASQAGVAFVMQGLKGMGTNYNWTLLSSNATWTSTLSVPTSLETPAGASYDVFFNVDNPSLTSPSSSAISFRIWGVVSRFAPPLDPVQDETPNQARHLLWRALEVGMHKEYPPALTSPLYGKEGNEANGNPNVSGGSGPVSQDTSPTGFTPPGTQKPTWNFPLSNPNYFIPLAMANKKNGYGGPDGNYIIVPGGGGNFSPSFGATIDGVIYIDTGTTGRTVSIAGNPATTDITCDNPATPQIEYCPTILIVVTDDKELYRQNDGTLKPILKFLGNPNIKGVIYTNGSIDTGSSLTLDGAIFSGGAWVHGAAGTNITYDSKYVQIFAAGIFPEIIIDKMIFR